MKPFLSLCLLSLILQTQISFAGPPINQEDIGLKEGVEFNQGIDQPHLDLITTIDAAKALVASYPNDPKSHFELAAVYSRTNYLEEALKEVKRARDLIIEQNDPGFVLQTIKTYEQYLKKAPNDQLILYRLGLINYLNGYALQKPKYAAIMKNAKAPSYYFGRAKTSFNKVLALDPNDQHTKNYLGYLYFENENNPAQAIKLWKESLKIESRDNMAAYFLLANAYKKSGDVLNSLLYGAKALEIKSRIGIKN